MIDFPAAPPEGSPVPSPLVEKLLADCEQSSPPRLSLRDVHLSGTELYELMTRLPPPLHHFQGSQSFTDQNITLVAGQLTGLTSLSLDGCRQVTDAGVRAVADQLTGLTSLELNGCSQVTDAGVQIVAGQLTGLTSLKLGGCSQVTDAGVRAIADRLNGLSLQSLVEHLFGQDLSDGENRLLNGGEASAPVGPSAP